MKNENFAYLDFMTIDELKNMSGDNLAPQMKEVVELLSGALNDWPFAYETVQEYLAEIALFVGGELTKNCIVEKLSEIGDNILLYAWQAESLTQLVQIFNYCEINDLMEIEKVIKP
jgi:hypothetical protein